MEWCQVWDVHCLLGHLPGMGKPLNFIPNIIKTKQNKNLLFKRKLLVSYNFDNYGNNLTHVC